MFGPLTSPPAYSAPGPKLAAPAWGIRREAVMKYARVLFVLSTILVLTLAAPAQDYWLGGADNWYNVASWSNGVPTFADDVVIYSGIDDIVFLYSSGILTLNSSASVAFPTELLPN
jgi:hypothetical protein